MPLIEFGHIDYGENKVQGPSKNGQILKKFKNQTTYDWQITN